MDTKITLQEVTKLFKQILKREKGFETIRFNGQEDVGEYLPKETKILLDRIW